jgi:hypothetical protein
VLIKAFGIFWRADEVWPGTGRGRRELLGRRGSHAGHLRVCNFWRQQGLYVLYHEYGPYYVGLVGRGTRGTRLYAHNFRDDHAGKWDRFSWFGFCELSGYADERGVGILKPRSGGRLGSSDDAIRDVEALLILSLGPRANKHFERFGDAHEWTQVPADRRDDLLGRL